MRYLAIERFFGLVGECMKQAVRSEPSLASILPDVSQVIGMRNRLVHDYDAVDSAIVWDTAFNDIPIVVQNIRQIIEDESAP